MPMMRVGRCRAILFFCGCLNYVDGFNGRSSEYVFDTDVHGGSWQGSESPILSPSNEADARSASEVEGAFCKSTPHPAYGSATSDEPRRLGQPLLGIVAGLPPTPSS